MTFFAAIAVLLVAATTLLVFAGREYLRINVYPPVQPRSVDDLAGLAWLRLLSPQPGLDRGHPERMNRPISDGSRSATATAAAERSGAVAATARRSPGATAAAS